MKLSWYYLHGNNYIVFVLFIRTRSNSSCEMALDFVTSDCGDFGLFFLKLRDDRVRFAFPIVAHTRSSVVATSNGKSKLCCTHSSNPY